MSDKLGRSALLSYPTLSIYLLSGWIWIPTSCSQTIGHILSFDNWALNAHLLLSVNLKGLHFNSFNPTLKAWRDALVTSVWKTNASVVKWILISFWILLTNVKSNHATLFWLFLSYQSDKLGLNHLTTRVLISSPSCIEIRFETAQPEQHGCLGSSCLFYAF